MVLLTRQLLSLFIAILAFFDCSLHLFNNCHADSDSPDTTFPDNSGFSTIDVPRSAIIHEPHWQEIIFSTTENAICSINSINFINCYSVNPAYLSAQASQRTTDNPPAVPHRNTPVIPSQDSPVNQPPHDCPFYMFNSGTPIDNTHISTLPGIAILGPSDCSVSPARIIMHPGEKVIFHESLCLLTRRKTFACHNNLHGFILSINTDSIFF